MSCIALLFGLYYVMLWARFAQLVEQRVSTLCEAGSNPVIALKFFTEVSCIISVMEEIPASGCQVPRISGIKLQLLCVVRIELAC